jgi:thiamine-monophosphate kinase
MMPPAAASRRDLALGPGAEFDRIRSIARALGDQTSGLGDDCGLLREGDQFFALSTDLSMEGVHFRRDWIGPGEVGWRAAAAALSDLAAEGADPVGLLCAVGMPASAPEPDLTVLMKGVGAAAQYAGATVLGGDLSVAPLWMVTVTVIGRTRAPVTRGGAVPGDRLWVTGSLGGPRAAIEAWRRGGQPQPGARDSYARPKPRIAAGRWLARHGARAMIDLSDGLGGDAAHLAAASRVALEIDLDAIPVAPEVTPEAELVGSAPSEFAARGGEDFELLVALPGRFNAADAFVRECGIGLTRIGTVMEGTGVRFLLRGQPISVQGFDHFG